MSAPVRVDLQWGRRMVLIDVENVAGGLVCNEECARSARLAVNKAVGRLDADQVVVATCHKGYPYVAWCWPTARRVVRSGVDGADLALLDVLGEDVAARYQQVVLVSGDGIFADALIELAVRGVRVTVAARRGHISRRLRLACWRVVYLDEALLKTNRSAG